MSSRYFCYQCQRNVDLRDADLACGVCGGEFIEQIAAAPRVFPNPGQRIPPTGPAPATSQAGGNMAGFHFNQQPAGAGSQPMMGMPAGLMQMLNAALASQPGGRGAGDNNPAPQANNAQNTAGGGGVPQLVEGLLQNLVTSMQQGGAAGLEDNGVRVHFHIGGGPPISLGTQRLHGNPGDYVFGNMDRLVSELMNQVDQYGQQVQGISEDDLRRIPMIKVNQKHVDNQTQCSTCFEMFGLDETVAELNCHHIFHRACVEPWLAQHRTCPICRTDVDPTQWPQATSDESRNPTQPSSDAPTGLMDIDDLD